MKTIRKITICFSLLIMVALILTSCDKYNYTDKLQKLGARVETLEAMVLEANINIALLNEVIHAIETRGYITDVVKNADGSYTIKFNTGKTYTIHNGRNGADGKDGKDAIFQISAEQDPNDGIWYWTVNGQWLLDNNGDKVRAGATDGKDGKDGKSSSESNVFVPQVRINPDTLNWEISTDGGNTWTDTGFCAAGKDGTDGEDGHNGTNGKNGQDDMFLEIIPAVDGSSITFVLRDGRTFTVPITK
ncbi:MAG: hypothetical protein IJ902_06240 [Prevotella sp.]|nr:hypothetical protein [Prevotella sp.]